MPAPRPTPREAALAVAQELLDAGFIAYFAGGCVRDRLLAIEPKDYDVATDARPEQVLGLFPRAQRIGEAFGVVLVRIRGCPVEVATFRTDGVYSDSRRPDRVEFSDAEHDARRRDFTINGLFEDPRSGAVVDFVGGRADLAARLIRAIGNPADRLSEDRLRMLRAVRFAARFGFRIEPATAAAIRAHALELPGVSRERIGQEISWMIGHPSRAVAAGLIQDLGLDAPVLGEPPRDPPPDLPPPLTRLAGLPPESCYPTGLTAWLLDRMGRPPADEAVLAERARRWASALTLSNADHGAFDRCLRVWCRLRGSWRDLAVAGRKRLAAGPGFEGALAIIEAEDRAAAAALRADVARLEKTGLAPAPLISGDDLIALGLAPGPIFRRVLDAVYDAQLEGRVEDRAGALDLAAAAARMVPGEAAGGSSPS